MMSTRRGKRRGSRGFGGGLRGTQLIIYGAIAFAIGLAITIGTYSAAASNGGGHYIISFGPMVAGVLGMVRGSFHVLQDRRARAQQVGGPSAGAYGIAGGGYGAPGYPQPGYAQPGYAPQGDGAPGYGTAAPASSGAGWFPDPQDPTLVRWWDGQSWTDQARPNTPGNPAGPSY